MATGQGITWVVVADGHHARMLEVEDAGLPPRLKSTVDAPPPEGQHRPPQHGWTHGGDPRPEHDERRFAQVVIHALERGAASNQFRHLVVVAPPRLLGMLREALPRSLATRLRASSAKDWGRLTEPELLDHVRPLVEIWGR
jgi:protein required for attachment to host cells